MGRINITKEHYDYANMVVKIFGFNNLVDYLTVVSYHDIQHTNFKQV